MRMFGRGNFVVWLGLMFVGYSGVTQAQEPACGLRSVRETVAPVYPPIARAAHVSGVVVVLASFDLAGNVTEAHVVSGPEMLKAAAVTFVLGWQANAYGGSRSCPVVVEYAMDVGPACEDRAEPSSAGRVDPLHYRVTAPVVWLCDPAATVGKRRKFLGIF